VVGTVDILPTLLEVTGISEPKGLDGRSLVSILQGSKQDDREFVYVMYEENVGGNRQPMRAILSKDFAYICNLWSDGQRRFATATRGMASTTEMFRLAEEGNETMQHRCEIFDHSVPEQFFDINKDADALNNLFGQPKYEDLIKRHQKQMVRTMEMSNDPMLETYSIPKEPLATSMPRTRTATERSTMRRQN
jgi:N-sulfoglucosamine sulfohydrolase